MLWVSIPKAFHVSVSKIVCSIRRLVGGHREDPRHYQPKTLANTENPSDIRRGPVSWAVLNVGSHEAKEVYQGHTESLLSKDG